MPRDDDFDENDRPRRRRPRDEEDDDRPRRRARRNDDDDDRPARSRRQPADDDDESRRKKKKTNLALVLGIIAGVLVLCCGGLGAVGYFFWNRIGGPAQQQLATTNDLREIGLAMHHHDARNGFLPNNSYDRQGRPLLSWRVHLLPHFGPEEEALYRQFNLNEPWDSATNRPLLARMPGVYGSKQAGSAEGFTYYRGFSHQGAIFEKPRNPGVPERISMAAITDGPTSTIFVVEAGASVEWTRPLDLDWSPGLNRPVLGNSERPYCLVLMGDGSVRRLRKDVGDVVLRNLIDRRDGNVIPPGWEQ